MKSSRFDAIVIGAGITGLYFLYRLRELGFTVQVIEDGGGVGGTWYWNRYPGARFDSESYTYCYSFSEELLQEWDWTEHYAGQPETERYLNYFADKFDLRENIQFNSRVTAAVFDDSDSCWRVQLDDGNEARAQFLITAVGGLSARYVPNFAGLSTFKGVWCHTNKWPRDGIDMSNKRVGVIGTGATGVQVITEIAKEAAHLTVFQRTPNYCVPLRNRPIDRDEMLAIKASYPEIFRDCAETPNGFQHRPDARLAMEVSQQERLSQFERLWAEPGFKKFLSNFRDVLRPGPANDEYSEFVRTKIRERVRDRKLAEKLAPKHHPFGSKRTPCESGYYEVYNQDNVRLVDVLEDPIQGIVPEGVVTRETTHHFDVLVFATGYDFVTGALDQIHICGLGGRALKEKFANGLRAYMGIQSSGFPNLFLSALSFGNFVRGREPLVDWVCECMHYMRRKNFTRISATREAEDAWTEHVIEVTADSLLMKSNSQFVGANIPGKPRFALISPDPLPTMKERLAAIAANGYEGFQFG